MKCGARDGASKKNYFRCTIYKIECYLITFVKYIMIRRKLTSSKEVSFLSLSFFFSFFLSLSFFLAVTKTGAWGGAKKETYCHWILSNWKRKMYNYFFHSSELSRLPQFLLLGNYVTSCFCSSLRCACRSYSSRAHR